VNKNIIRKAVRKAVNKTINYREYLSEDIFTGEEDYFELTQKARCESKH
jgi:hypothetical protein